MLSVVVRDFVIVLCVVVHDAVIVLSVVMRNIVFVLSVVVHNVVIVLSVVVRDMGERMRSLDAVLSQYVNFVKPAFEEFCLPVRGALLSLITSDWRFVSNGPFSWKRIMFSCRTFSHSFD